MVDASEQAFGVVLDSLASVELAMSAQREKKKKALSERRRLQERTSRSFKLDTAHKLAQKRAKKFKAVDVCFVFDISASMDPYLSAAAAKISEIGGSMLKLLGEGATMRVAFVGYRDYGDDKPLEVMPFTTDLAAVRVFVESLSAEGGGDVCEDVLSGLEAAVDLEWSATTRVLFLLSQTPHHGRRFRSSKQVRVCSNPDAIRCAVAKVSVPEEKRGGLQKWMETQMYDLFDEDARQWEPMDRALQKIRSLHVQLFCLRVGKDSELLAMDAVFRKVYDDGDAGRYLKVIPITADPDVFCRAVVSSTSESISMSVSSLQLGSTSVAKFGRTLLPVTVLAADPDWETRTGWRSVAGDLISYDVTSLDCKPSKKTRPCNISLRTSPFSQGAMRFAFYMYDEDRAYKLVGKVYKHNDAQHQHRDTYEGDMRTQAFAHYLAQEFSERCPEYPLQFVPAQLLVLHETNTLPYQHIAVEPWISGHYEKKTSNTDYVSKDSDLEQAFSHWTYDFTGGEYMVTDIQGVASTLTDPQIHSDIDMFGRGNHGEMGMDNFFRAHICNDICRMLHLKPHAAQLGAPLPLVVAAAPPQEQGPVGLTPVETFRLALRAGATSALGAGTSSSGSAAPALEELAGAIIKWEHPPSVIAVAAGSPASKAMLEPGCCLVRVDGDDVTQMPRDAVLRLLAKDDSSLSFEWSPEGLNHMIEEFCGLRLDSSFREQLQKVVDALCRIVMRSHEGSPDMDTQIASVQKAKEALTAQVQQLADGSEVDDIFDAMRAMWTLAEEGCQKQVREAIEQRMKQRGEDGLKDNLHVEMFTELLDALMSGGLEAIEMKVQKKTGIATKEAGEPKQSEVVAEPTPVTVPLQEASRTPASAEPRADQAVPQVGASRPNGSDEGIPQGAGPVAGSTAESKGSRPGTPVRRRSLAPTKERQAALRRASSGLLPELRKQELVCDGKCGGWVEVDKLEYQAEGQVVLCEACKAKVSETTEEVPCTAPGCTGRVEISRFLQDLYPSMAPPTCTDCGATFHDAWVLLPHGAPSSRSG